MKTKFWTGHGDGGESFFGKVKLPKSDAVFDTMGELDELNAIIGYCRVEAGKKFRTVGEFLRGIQDVLFIIQAEIAADKFNFKMEKHVSPEHVVILEKEISVIDRQIPEIKNFRIPGGSELSSRLELARTATRRTERTLVKYLKHNARFNPNSLAYLNRLSSILFALSRFVNFKLKIKEESPKY